MPEPALFKHCQTVYNAMLSDPSVQEQLEALDSRPQTPPRVIWKGHATLLIDGLDVPKGYYAKIMDCLKQMGSVQQLRRGGGRPPSPSEWLLIKPPDPAVFDEARRPKTQESTIVLTQRVKDLTSQVQTLNGQMARVLRLINEMSQREGL